MGTAANDKVRAYILRTLTEMGVEAEELPARRVSGKTCDVSTSVIGRIPGAANSKAFALMAHFDSVPFGPGAALNAAIGRGLPGLNVAFVDNFCWYQG